MTQILSFTLQWDPQIRGIVIFLAAVAVLPGSVYLLLATNTGARLGMLIALTGLFGWMALLGGVWTVYALAQGPRGREAAWVVRDVVIGDLSESTLEVVDGFPKRWRKLKSDDPDMGEATAAADQVLVPAAAGGGEGGHEGESASKKEEPGIRYQSPFSSAEDYIVISGHTFGGENYFPGGLEHPKGFLHKPHYALIQVGSVKEQETIPGQAPPKKVRDPAEPITSVIMIRDLGNVRRLPFLFTIFTFTWFLFLAYKLHVRDKAVMALRASEPA